MSIAQLNTPTFGSEFGHTRRHQRISKSHIMMPVRCCSLQRMSVASKGLRSLGVSGMQRACCHSCAYCVCIEGRVNILSISRPSLARMQATSTASSATGAATVPPPLPTARLTGPVTRRRTSPNKARRPGARLHSGWWFRWPLHCYPIGVTVVAKRHEASGIRPTRSCIQSRRPHAPASICLALWQLTR
jgi:hypothetical protein